MACPLTPLPIITYLLYNPLEDGIMVNSIACFYLVYTRISLVFIKPSHLFSHNIQMNNACTHIRNENVIISDRKY